MRVFPCIESMTPNAVLILAQQGAPEGGGGSMMLIIMMLFVGGMWFLMMSSQRKRQKEHRALVDSLKQGDEVMTNGGIIGNIVTVKDDRVKLRTGDNTTMDVAKQFVQSRLQAKKK